MRIVEQQAEEIKHRVVIIDRGRLVADGSPAELMSAGSGAQIHFGAPSGIDVAELGAVLEAPVTETRPGEYLVKAEATPTKVAALTSWLASQDLPLADLRAGRENLEDVFLRLTASTDEPSTVERSTVDSAADRRSTDQHEAGSS